MILLNGHSLTPARKIPLEAMSLQLKERESSATITPADMTGIQVNSWVKDEGEPGDGIVWRVRSIQQAYATDTPTVQLEHAIGTLRDTLLFGEITAAQITGNPKATTCTAEQAVRYILSKQSDWVLGSFGYSVSNPYKFDGDSLYDALETVSASLGEAWWSYDFSVYPFRLHINMASNREESELRVGRNLRTISRTVDKTGMYTRFYPIGKDDLHIDGDYVDMNTGLYGVVAKVETDNNIDSKDELRRWANERLAFHSQPSVTIDVEGLELADATGVSVDRLRLGYYCRVPLPEYNTTIRERIVSLNYPDKVHSKEAVRITLANNREDVTKIIADAIKKSGRGGRSAGRQAKEDHAWFEDTNNHVAMCAEGIVGVDAQGNPNWKRLSQIIVNENGIETSVRSVQNGLVIAETAIKQNENAITLEAKRRADADTSMSSRITVEANRITQEVTRASAAEGVLSGRITVEADRITQEVTRASAAEGVLSGRITVEADRITQEVTRAQGAEGTLSGQITVEAGKINQVVSAVGADGQVTAASICLAINNGGSSATINADKIYLLGQTIANQINADYIATKVAAIPQLNANQILASGVKVVVGQNVSDVATQVYVSGCPYDLQIVRNGNTYTLQQKRLGYEATWQDVGSFSRATSLSGSWSGGTFTVAASPQGESITAQIFDTVSADVTWNGTTGSIKVYANLNGGETKYDTGKTLSVTAPFTSRTFVKAYNSDDTIYYGKLYNSSGTALTSSSYYWYGHSTNWSATQARATLYTRN